MCIEIYILNYIESFTFIEASSIFVGNEKVSFESSLKAIETANLAPMVDT